MRTVPTDTLRSASVNPQVRENAASRCANGLAVLVDVLERDGVAFLFFRTVSHHTLGSVLERARRTGATPWTVRRGGGGRGVSS